MNRQARRVHAVTTRVTCDRCGKKVTMAVANATDWNVTMKRGVIVGYLCPGCQTPEENAEAEINLATLDYSVDAFGRHIGFPKVATD